MSSYGLLTYLAWPEYNAGDYIQSLAAARFLPKVDFLKKFVPVLSDACHSFVKDNIAEV